MLINLISKVHAVGIGVKIPGSDKTNYTYDEYVATFLNWAIKIGLGLAVIMILYAGVKYIVSQGNPTAINDSKEIIIGAILGFLVLLLIQFILRALEIPTA